MPRDRTLITGRERQILDAIEAGHRPVWVKPNRSGNAGSWRVGPHQVLAATLERMVAKGLVEEALMPNPVKQLQRLADDLVEDILTRPYGEIEQEMRDDGIDPKAAADEVRAIFESVLGQVKAKNQPEGDDG